MPLTESLWPTLNPEERRLVSADAPWDALRTLDAALEALWATESEGYDIVVGTGASVDAAIIRARHVLVGPDVRVEPTAVLVGEHIVVRQGAVIRAGAYIRGPAYIGEGAIVGHATEVKSACLLHRSQAPHFAYVGDSIVGTGANLGAGTKLSNFRLDGREVHLRWDGDRISTGMRKLGALIGEGVQIGCNAVLNPGTILGPGVSVAPCATVRGTHTEPGLLRG